LTIRGEKEEALAHYREAARLKPGNALYQNDLGAALVGAGERVEALPHYQQAASLEPAQCAISK